jgi:Formin Homology 2 Domain
VILAGLKGLTPQQIRESLLAGDVDTLHMNRLQSLKAIMPISKKERLVLAAFEGDLHALTEADRFLIEMLPITRLPAKIDSLLFKLQADEQLTEANAHMDVIEAAIRELRNAKKFHEILHCILKIGKFLNRGTYLRGDGFRLATLMKVAETRTKHSGTTLLHYLVAVVENNDPSLLNFYDDLAHIDDASKSR